MSESIKFTAKTPEELLEIITEWLMVIESEGDVNSSMIASNLLESIFEFENNRPQITDE